MRIHDLHRQAESPASDLHLILRLLGDSQIKHRFQLRDVCPNRATLVCMAANLFAVRNT